jgi:NAD(P)-dependent dehydrogenase (short-subunit alcohol dehydrogenase family)
VRLASRRAVVAGAAGGIGSVVTRALLAEGAAVTALDVTEEGLERLREDAPERLRTAAVDLTDAAATHAAVDGASEQMGGLDAIANLVALDQKPATDTAETPIEMWDRQISVNLSSVFYVARAALPHMLAGGGGTLVHFTSVSGLRPWPRYGGYNAAKAGVVLLTKTIAMEYARQGIRANCVAPGSIDAGMTAAMGRSDEEKAAFAQATYPMGRLGTPEEAAEIVVWLSSDASSYTTGTVVMADGGFLA